MLCSNAHILTVTGDMSLDTIKWEFFLVVMKEMTPELILTLLHHPELLQLQTNKQTKTGKKMICLFSINQRKRQNGEMSLSNR